MTFPCPVCSAPLQLKELEFRVPFRCSRCHAELSIPNGYGLTGFLIALGLTCGLVYLWGARGYTLLFGVFVGFLPIQWIVFILKVAVSPPTIYVSGPPTIASGRGDAQDG
jgi:hypothetical protein